jgi:hypothetical protein
MISTDNIPSDMVKKKIGSHSFSEYSCQELERFLKDS